MSKTLRQPGQTERVNWDLQGFGYPAEIWICCWLYIKGCGVGRQDHVAVPSAASSQFPRYVQLEAGGLGQQVQSGRQRALSLV